MKRDRPTAVRILPINIYPMPYCLSYLLLLFLFRGFSRPTPLGLWTRIAAASRGLSKYVFM
jgi:hypothetical protein